MSRSPVIRLDPAILLPNLPSDVHSLVHQASANVDRAVDTIINEFKAETAAQLENFKNKQYPAEVSAALQKEVDALESEFSKVDALAAAIDQAARNAQTAAGAANNANAALTASLQAVNADVIKLKTELAEFKKKVQTFGEKSGGALATAAYKAFTGGIA